MNEALARDLEVLARSFEAGGWRELRIETDGLSVLFSTDPAAGGLESGHPILLQAAAARPIAAPASADAAIDPAWHPVAAPNLGTFYRSPKPGAPPFVELGQRVSAQTELCLLEVMKLFTSVKAGVAGTIRRIDAADAELVEGGQMLFHIEPE